MKEEKIIIEITEEYVQQQADDILDKVLSQDELDDVKDRIRENLWMYVMNNIHQVIEFNELVKRNEGASEHTPRYELYWRNEGAYQKDFKLIKAFFKEEDAKEYSYACQIGNAENEWKTVRVDGL